MPYAEANGIRIYYEELGSGPPLVLLNNLTGTLDETGLGGWATLRPYLAQRYHVVHVDSRGHGRTNNPDGPDAFALATLAADIAALIARLELGPAHVAGFSLGGIMGLELALARATPLRSVIGIGTNYTTNEKSRIAYLGLDPDRIEQEDPVWAADLARRHDPLYKPGYWRDLLRGVLAQLLPRVREVTDLEGITVPTLWIAGENEPFFELDQVLAMKRHIPGAEILIVNNAAHDPQGTHPHLVGPVIADFLSRNAEPPTR
jgi:pimeloyl-ACP methyl ester carboxylesterase